MPFMLRRVKSDVDLMIPPKKELIVYAPMTLDQQEFYEATIDRTILQKIENRNVSTVVVNCITRSLRGCRPGQTQTKLFYHGLWLEACNFRFKK